MEKLTKKEIAAMISRMKTIYEDEMVLSLDTKILAVIALNTLYQTYQSLYGEEVFQGRALEQMSEESSVD